MIKCDEFGKHEIGLSEPVVLYPMKPGWKEVYTKEGASRHYVLWFDGFWWHHSDEDLSGRRPRYSPIEVETVIREFTQEEMPTEDGKQYRICDDCKGECYRFEKRWFRKDIWTECKTCGGRGVVV